MAVYYVNIYIHDQLQKTTIYVCLPGLINCGSANGPHFEGEPKGFSTGLKTTKSRGEAGEVCKCAH